MIHWNYITQKLLTKAEGKEFMMNYWNTMNYGGAWGNFWSFMPLLLAWSLFWKGLALWKSARNDSRYWFVALLIVNTMGILELLYLFVFAKDKLVFVSDPKTVKKVAAKRRK